MAKKMLGEVNLLGLDEFGQPFGMSPIWGSLIGGGAAGVTTIFARHSGNATLMANSEITGLVTGLAVSGTLFAFRSTRHAALGSVVGAILASGIAWLERQLLGTAVVATATPAAVTAATPTTPGTSGMGLPMVRSLNGLGIPQVRALNGLGIPQISARPTPQGTIPGVAGSQLAGAGLSAPPVSLLGPASPQAAHLRGVGGPMAHGLAAAYGATLLGGGR